MFFLVCARRCLQTATPERRDAATTALWCEPVHGPCPTAIPAQSIPLLGDPPGCRHRMLGPLSQRMRSDQGWNNPVLGRVCRGDVGDEGQGLTVTSTGCPGSCRRQRQEKSCRLRAFTLPGTRACSDSSSACASSHPAVPSIPSAPAAHSSALGALGKETRGTGEKKTKQNKPHIGFQSREVSSERFPNLECPLAPSCGVAGLWPSLHRDKERSPRR